MSSSDESAPAARRKGDDDSGAESSDDELLFKFPQRGGEWVFSVHHGYGVACCRNGSGVAHPPVRTALPAWWWSGQGG